MARKSINHDASDGLCGTLFEPKSEWTPPKSFPNINGEKTLGLDIESHDPNLESKGPGFIRGDARVVGVSLSTLDRSWYFPIGHLGGGNMDRGAVTSFLRDVLSDSDRFVCGANLQYELEGLSSEDIHIKSKLIDVQIAEALIDEEAPSNSLDNLCIKYLGGHKDETLLREACANFGLKDVKGSLWKLPSKFVGPYAEYDANAPLHIFQKQLEILKAEDLTGIFQLESELLPLLWQMRKRGIRMDVEKAQSLSKSLEIKEKELRFEMKKKYGADIDEWSGPKLAMICDRLKINYPRTEAGNPSFTSDYIEGTIHPFFDDLSDLRELSKLRDTFVNGWILDNLVGDRIHCQWRQCASDEGGTRTGRMAAANPNPQQVPAGKYRKSGKPNDIGAMIRACFIPHEKNLKWAKFDYSAQEPRILTHFATLCDFTGARLAAMAYRNNRKFDIYQLMVEAAGIDRRPAKDCYLGRCYGMGRKKLAAKLNKTLEEADRILKKFDEGVPFVKEIADSCSSTAQKRGYIKTLLGRRRHFKFFEPVDAYKMRQAGEDVVPVREDQAHIKWPNHKLQRSNTHKALNALIQGSAADMTKAAILACHKEHGNILPYMQVHDELNYGVESEEHARKLQQTKENCVSMQVPVVTDMNIGEHWK